MSSQMPDCLALDLQIATQEYHCEGLVRMILVFGTVILLIASAIEVLMDVWMLVEAEKSAEIFLCTADG